MRAGEGFQERREACEAGWKVRLQMGVGGAVAPARSPSEKLVTKRWIYVWKQSPALPFGAFRIHALFFHLGSLSTRFRRRRE
eukprot:363645-Chlamydomonas_euryale.AAC.6